MTLDTILTGDDLLDHLAGRMAYASLHTADPGTIGAHEVSGGGVQGPGYVHSPPYTRQRITWAPAVGGKLANRETVTLSVPGGTRVTHVGYWTAAGLFTGSSALEVPETFGGPGTYSFAPGNLCRRLV